MERLLHRFKHFKNAVILSQAQRSRRILARNGLQWATKCVDPSTRCRSLRMTAFLKCLTCATNSPFGGSSTNHTSFFIEPQLLCFIPKGFLNCQLLIVNYKHQFAALLSGPDKCVRISPVSAERRGRGEIQGGKRYGNQNVHLPQWALL